MSVPIPPFGDKVGEMGSLKLSLKVAYEPKITPQRQTTANEDYAWEQFFKSKPKLLTDK